MSESCEMLVIWLTYLKELDKWSSPKIALAFLCDMFTDDQDQISLYKDILVSDIGERFVRQISSGDMDCSALFSDANARFSDHERVLAYMRALSRVFGVQVVLGGSADQTAPEETETEKSAEEYYQIACSQKTNLGMMDASEYITNLEKAAEMGHLQAMERLARHYMKGKYVVRDEKKAVEWYKKCADMKSGQSCYDLYLYFRNRGINEEERNEYLKMASEYDVTAAHYDLAMLYLQSPDMQKQKQAVSLLLKAGEKGDSGAYYQLAVLYRFGRGVEKNMMEARNMLEKAADLGHSEAKKILSQGVI